VQVRTLLGVGDTVEVTKHKDWGDGKITKAATYNGKVTVLFRTYFYLCGKREYAVTTKEFERHELKRLSCK
jgi:hypothetical protein